MKRLVLLGEGHGEVRGLPTLIRRLLAQKDPEQQIYVDKDVLRAHSAASLVKWDKKKQQPDFSEWTRHLGIAAKRRDITGVLAVFDGDEKRFPAGGPSAFCASRAAKDLCRAARHAGAGALFSVAVVFACVEYETWLIAGAESLIGKQLTDGRLVLPVQTPIPQGDPESHGKGWLERHMPNYRPTRDQEPLSEIVDLDLVRRKNLRSFTRLEHALDQILSAVKSGTPIASPA